MNYDEMSDFEINKAVAKKLGIGLGIRQQKSNINAVRVKNGMIFDYCNNWEDIGPIIVDNRITITPYQDESQGWFATTDTSFFVDDINTLRAAAICFLMMQESK